MTTATMPSAARHSGLTDAQVEESRQRYGHNTLTPPPREPWWSQLLEKFEDPTIRILLAAAAVSILMTALEKYVLHHADAGFIDSIGIIIAVALATLCGFFSELKSAREFEFLNKVKDDIKIKVLRNRQVTEISINDVAVGDIVHLALGDKVPADGTVIESNSLLIDESVMTGESAAVEKSCDDTMFRGTMVADGHGQLIVTEVGDNTKLGQIAAHLGKAASDSDTPLTQKLSKLASQISLVGMTSAALIFAVMAGFAFYAWTPDWTNGTLAGLLPLLKDVLTAFIVAVTIIVVAVPEGLPMMVTVSLALNMMKMAKENCLIRKLVASETIGSANVICTDKTGTLTQNKMTVNWLYAGNSDTEDLVKTVFVLPAELIESIAVNTTAELNIGNPTECALLMFLQNNGIDYKDYRDKYKRIKELSHNSERKMSLVEVEKDGKTVSFTKGAPEKIIPQCRTFLVSGERHSIEKHKNNIDKALQSAAKQALRVLAIAQDETLLALIGISDPMRPEVPHAVAVCRQAGVDVKMITGDAKPTAVAIAKQAGILSSDADVILTSDELAELSDEALDNIIPHLKVLARSTPLDKLRLVKVMHHKGEVVAMTGDGTNDAPALKFADVGISMGITGTEVAKEASDIVLIDDNFKSIVTGIWWGRTLYQNIQKFLQFQLSVNVVALTCALIGPFAGISLPLTVPQLLWINIIMDTFAALALSTDPPRESSMKRKPVGRDASIITPSMGLTIITNSIFQVAVLFSALYFGWFLDDEHQFKFFTEPRDPANIQALTVFFTIFVMFQFWNIFNCRSLRAGESPFALLHKNRLFLAIAATIAAVQFALVQVSPYCGIGQIFRTETLTVLQWGGIALLTVPIIPFAWAVRKILSAL
ncbi:MAG: calcium-translocating P-type ATPase, PMCA-type [Planctomycetaceae bacterium]|jgi:Ca2+-transporting ATPase|nr:calcium-translocating P-type ATPase, PMCA-type [Planctomycetaceae bacterium]